MAAALAMTALPVADPAAAAAFLAAAFGWPRHPKSSARAVFVQAGPALVALARPADIAAELGLPADACAGRLALLACHVAAAEEVAAVLARGEAAGGVIVRPAAATAWGGVRGVARDPDGHLWEVVWNPRWPLGADGRLA